MVGLVGLTFRGRGIYHEVMVGNGEMGRKLWIWTWFIDSDLHGASHYDLVCISEVFGEYR
jgi:hypothetical protein